MNNDKLFTAGFVIWGIICLALSIGMIVIAIHFVTKFW